MPTNSNPDILEEIRIGLQHACARMPPEPERQREEVEYLLRKDEQAKEGVADARQEAGVKDAETRLNKLFGVSKVTMQILRKLHPMKPGDRAAVLGQVSTLAFAMGYTDRDLVDMMTTATKGVGEDIAQGSVFDSTKMGKAMGGEPRYMEPPAAAPEPAPTPGMDLAEAQAKFEEHLAAYKAKGGKGRKPKALTEAEAAVTAAAKAQAEQEHAAKAENSADGDGDDFEDDIPEPTSRSPLAGATGQGNYTIG